VSTRAFSIESGNKRKEMIGMLCGARRNKLIGCFKNIDFSKGQK
jgi:hypothetical protein